MGHCLVAPAGNDPASHDYQSYALPLSYGAIEVVGRCGIEPLPESAVLQTAC